MKLKKSEDELNQYLHDRDLISRLEKEKQRILENIVREASNVLDVETIRIVKKTRS